MAAKTNTADRRVPASKKRAARKSPWVKAFKIAACIFGIVVMTGAIAGCIVWLGAVKWADDQLNQSLFTKLSSFASGNATVMLARDGKTVLYTSSDATRDPIADYKDIPQNVIHATLAAEDKRFFEHAGVDLYSVVRSVVTDVKQRRSAEGASTLTMQLVKRLYTSPEKTFSRKLHDAALAVELEKMLTKQEVLKDYLNQVYYGEGAYGFKAAAEVYLGKSDLKKLSIGEAAMLARLVRRPSEENPFKDPKGSIANRNDVLDTELSMGWISQDEYNKAKKEKLHLARVHFGSGETIYHAPYFVRYVLDCLKRDYPDRDFKAGGYTIYTTLDAGLEHFTEREVKNQIQRNRRSYRVTTGACMLMNSDGEILSMVGGIDFIHHQYNAVVQGRRQPGSSFKPIVYSAALSTGAISPNQGISSGPFHYVDPYSGKSWDPDNDNGFGGMVSITQAIAGSINTAAARVCEAAGPDTVVSYAHSVFGYTSPLKPVLSIALGSQAVSPIEQAQAYSIFMLHGDRATPYGVTRIVDGNNQVVGAYNPDIHRNMLDPNVAAQMDVYLRAVVTGGTGRAAGSVPDARGKTGTTQDNRDGWFCGYTNNLLAICWVSNEHFDEEKKQYYYDPMSSRSFGGNVPTYIWSAVMHAAQDKYGKGNAPATEDVVKPSRDSERDNSNKTDDSDDQPIKVDNGQDSTDSDSDKTAPPDSQSDTDQPDGDPKSSKPAPASSPDNQPDTNTVTEDKPKRSRHASTELVSVEICADTGLRATVYCPETVTRVFVKGTEPTRYCTKHHP